ncbi:MAG: cytochrome c, partial [Verrucomicrobiaceae bacterium]
MDPSRDNPVIRFTTFWWAIGTFLIFALPLAVIWLFTRSETETMEDAASKPRYETKAKIDAAQASSLPDADIEAAVAGMAKTLAASKPAAVELPTQIVPGSETSKKLASSGSVDTSEIDASNHPVDPKVVEAGQAGYLICGACHGQNGEGGPMAPPLAGSEWVTGPISNLIRIQLRGLTGPITVAGKEYELPAPMAPLSFQTDEQIAEVLTYVRNS